MNIILLLSCPSPITNWGLRLSPFSPQAESENSVATPACGKAVPLKENMGETLSWFFVP